MTDYAVMPKADYVAVCDAIREKTGDNEVIKSGELISKLNDVYNAGAVNVLQGSKYMCPTVSGEVLKIDDMSAVSHKVSVTKRSDTVENLEAVKVKKLGKNLATAQQIYTNCGNFSELVEDDRNCIRFIDSGDKYTGIIFKENTQYTFSFDAKREIRSGEGYHTSMILRIYYTDGTSNNITITNFIPYGEWVHLTTSSAVNKTIESIGVPAYHYLNWIYIDVDTFQIEEGATETEYEPYTMEYVGESFESTPDIVTLMPETSGVILDCRYCRDIDKYIENCFNSK